MPTVTTLSELTELVREHAQLFVRWSRGPDVDARVPSSDGLTGVPLPGLPANPLAVEPWWEDRPLQLWVARRLYDYSHLEHEKGPGVRPWVLVGREVGRGPDNEPLVASAARIGTAAAGHVVIITADSQVPATHVSPDVQRLPSSHGFRFGVYMQPSVVSQVSSVQGLPSSHTSAGPGWHVPSAGLQVSAPLHGSPSSQTTAAPTHAPAAQVSPVVHRLPSSHGFVLSTWAQPELGSQLSSVHGFPSLQIGATPG